MAASTDGHIGRAGGTAPRIAPGRRAPRSPPPTVYLLVPQLAARQGRATGTLWRWPQPPSLR